MFGAGSKHSRIAASFIRLLRAKSYGTEDWFESSTQWFQTAARWRLGCRRWVGDPPPEGTVSIQAFLIAQLCERDTNTTSRTRIEIQYQDIICKVYLASGFYCFADGAGWRIAAKNVGDVDIVGCVNDETTVLYLATDAQERQKSNTWFDDNFLIVLK